MIEEPKANLFSYEMRVARVEPVFWFEEEERVGRFVYNSRDGCLGLMADDIQVPLEVSLLGTAAVFSYQFKALREINPGDTVIQTHVSRRVRNYYGFWALKNETHNQIIKVE